MGGFMGIGGSSQKTDRKNELTGFEWMKNVFNFAMPTGAAALKTAQSTLAAPTNYFSKLLSGNRTAVQSAVAPQANDLRAAADAQKKQAATMGTERGGGIAAFNAERDTTTSGQIENMAMRARQGAGEELSKIGAVELNEATNLLGLGGNTAANFTNIALNSRATSQQINQQTVGDITGAIEAALMFA